MVQMVVVGVHNCTRKAEDASISVRACTELEFRLGQICRCLPGKGSRDGGVGKELNQGEKKRQPSGAKYMYVPAAFLNMTVGTACLNFT